MMNATILNGIYNWKFKLNDLQLFEIWRHRAANVKAVKGYG